MRNDDRQKHIGIKVRYLWQDHWEQVEALDWNRVGFNFHSTHSITETQLEFKRGLIRFDGSIVWRAMNTDPEVVRTVLVNELLYQKARDATNDTQLHARLVKLIRADGLQTEKRKALTTLGLNMSDERLHAMVQKRQSENPMYRYGVKVESDVWSAIVQSAREVTSVVDALEKWSGALGPK
jgi:hypothetical protein